MSAHAITGDEAEAMADWFDAAVAASPIRIVAPSVEALLASAWLYRVRPVSQDDLDAVHDALVEIPRCPACDIALDADSLWGVSGTQSDGCDVDELVYSCAVCDESGVL